MPTVSAAVRAPIVAAMFAWRDEIVAMKCPTRLVMNLVHPNVVVYANAADIMESAACHQPRLPKKKPRLMLGP